MFALEAEQIEIQEAQDSGAGEHEVGKLSKKIRSRGSRSQVDENLLSPDHFKEITPIDKRQRSRKKGTLSLSERIQIVQQVLVGQ